MLYTIWRRHEINEKTARNNRPDPISVENSRVFWWCFKSCRCTEAAKRLYEATGHMNFYDTKTVRKGGPQSQDREEVHKRIACAQCGRSFFLDADDFEVYIQKWAEVFYVQELASVQTITMDAVHKLVRAEDAAGAYLTTRPATEDERMRYYGFTDFQPVTTGDI